MKCFNHCGLLTNSLVKKYILVNLFFRKNTKNVKDDLTKQRKLSQITKKGLMI